MLLRAAESGLEPVGVSFHVGSQQLEPAAWDLADDLGGPGWSSLSLPVDGVPAPFHYRESEYGWVVAGSTSEGVHLGAYGHGMSAYGLGFSVVKDITAYAR